MPLLFFQEMAEATQAQGALQESHISLGQGGEWFPSERAGEERHRQPLGCPNPRNQSEQIQSHAHGHL